MNALSSTTSSEQLGDLRFALVESLPSLREGAYPVEIVIAAENAVEQIDLAFKRANKGSQ